MAIKPDTLITPSQRRRVATAQPSRAEAANPLHDYLVPARDIHGSSVSIHLSTIPDARRAASILVAKGLFGFENEQDVMRWCVHNGLIELGRRAKDKEVVSVMNLMNSWVRTACHQLEYLKYEKTLKGIESTIDLLIASGRAVKAEQLADMVWRQVDGIDDPDWKAEFKKMVKKKLDQARTAVARGTPEQLPRKGNGKGGGR